MTTVQAAGRLKWVEAHTTRAANFRAEPAFRTCGSNCRFKTPCKLAKCRKPLIYGDPGPIRTGDLPLRRGTLYPAELRGHWQRERIPRLAEWTKRGAFCRTSSTSILCTSTRCTYTVAA
jgi:hypothetical protein